MSVSAPDRADWTVVVPMKLLAVAKTRLAALAGARREALALAFAADTVAAALSCERVRHLLVVTDEPAAREPLSALGADIVPDEPGAGLNAALRHGAAVARRHWPADAVGALSGDLPALRAGDLAAALDEAAHHAAAFVSDSEGTGTTLLTATAGQDLGPAFGPQSRAAHLAAGAVLLEDAAWVSLRRDVDTAAQLRTAARLGLGPRTATILADLAWQ